MTTTVQLVSPEFNVHWTGDPNTTVTVFLEDGHAETFTSSGGGAFTTEAGLFKTLVENPDNSLTLTRKDQVRYELAATGELTSLVDRNGNTIACAYDLQEARSSHSSLTLVTRCDGEPIRSAIWWAML